MDLPINDKDLATIINALSLGGDTRLYHLLKEVKSRLENLRAKGGGCYCMTCGDYL